MVYDLDVLHLAKCGLPDRLTLMELCRLLINERAKAEPTTAKVHCLEEQVCAAEEYLESHCVVRGHVDRMTDERAPLNMETDQVEAECHPLADRIRELAVAVAACY